MRRVVQENAPLILAWVEDGLASLTKRRLKRGVFVSVVDRQAAINRFVVEHNTRPKPFTWTADPDKIIRAVSRGHQVLDSIHLVVVGIPSFDNGRFDAGSNVPNPVRRRRPPLANRRFAAMAWYSRSNLAA